MRQVGTELFHDERQTGGRTGITMLIATFRNAAKAPKNNNDSKPITQHERNLQHLK